jgi:hypothetical protein
VIDARGKAVLPGLINTHTHLAMVLFRGLADDLELEDWLNNYIFPVESASVTHDFVVAGTRLGLAEMIRGGVSTYCDMYYFEDAVGHALIVPAIGPHAVYTVGTKHLKQVHNLAERLDIPIVIHIAEAPSEPGYTLKHFQARPVAYLDRIGFLSPRVIGAHESRHVERGPSIWRIRSPSTRKLDSAQTLKRRAWLKAGRSRGTAPYRERCRPIANPRRIRSTLARRGAAAKRSRDAVQSTATLVMRLR